MPHAEWYEAVALGSGQGRKRLACILQVRGSEPRGRPAVAPVALGAGTCLGPAMWVPNSSRLTVVSAAASASLIRVDRPTGERALGELMRHG